MAFALALQSVHELPDGHGQTIFTATTAIVVVTVSHPSLKVSVLIAEPKYITFLCDH